MLDVAKLTPDQAQQLSALLSQLTGQQQATRPRRQRKRAVARIKHFTQEQVAAFFAAIASPRDTAIFRLAYHRGLRASEIGALQLADVDLRRERITFERLKGSNGGQYHLCKSELLALRKWLAVRGHEPGVLFPSRNHTPISQPQLWRLMRKYGAAAGLPAELCHPHSLKHSCATHLFERGESIEDVQDHLGHRNIQNTLIYARFTSSRRQARDKRLREW